ncbi:hypothetical protein CCACVL1_10625 [Corchorus capsularis]|uniref:Uncharacterized protein n=1 Tax=Corchorus capsularis TaxID=210143 RepID=A0A1R3IQI0_COCAP|nr:hypothetical protein CCACVL1_10625 [Corchorus capsularis]
MVHGRMKIGLPPASCSFATSSCLTQSQERDSNSSCESKDTRL